MEKLLLIPAITLMIIWSSCANTHISEEAEYKGQKVIVTSKEKKGFSTNSITYYVQLGEHKKIPVDAFTTDIYGAPYSSRIFSKVPHYIFENDSTLYTGKIDFGQKFTPTVLYFNPDKYSKETFEAYAGFFRNGWPEIVAKMNKDYTYFSRDIIGVVYGEKDDFVQYFTGTYMDKPYYFEIQAEGTIYFRNGIPPDNTGFEGSGLNNKVQMPGYRIIISDTSMFTPEKLKAFKDKDGKTMADYFTIEVMNRENNTH